MKVRSFAVLLMIFLAAPACDDDAGGMQPDAHEGIVRDYTGRLDGCGYVIELLNGEKLVPVELADSSFHFYDGQHVEVWYTGLTDINTICMAGKSVRIDSIRCLGCDALTPWSRNLPSDSFRLEEAKIVGDCLVLTVQYSGGCQSHDFFLSLVPTLTAQPVVTLAHDAHGDMCEAWITDKRSFDLTPLQSPGSHQTTFLLTLHMENAPFSKEFTYHY